MFLPMSRAEMSRLDWHYVDFLLISGDAYVDHPSFAAAIIGRWLEHLGYRVGIIAQPDFKDAASVTVLGRPRYGILIAPGNLDSMLNLYTAAKKPRRQDAYSPGGKAGKRPERAAIVYSRLAKAAYPDLPVIVGGIEASLRRFVHYDFWDDALRPSVLEESGADLLIYGMGEKPLALLADALSHGKKIGECQEIRGTCYLTEEAPAEGELEIPGFQKCLERKKEFAQAFRIAEEEQNYYDGKRLWQKQKNSYLVQNPPPAPLTTAEMDEIYELPFARTWHPSYDPSGGVPALAEVEYSILSHRGCFGSCSFCAIGFHQGRIIQNRSDASLLREAALLSKSPGFKGYIHDVGGPTANFRGQGCSRSKEFGPCRKRQCMWPEPCKQLKPDHSAYGKLLAEMATIPGIKKVFIRSGLRYDYLMLEKNQQFLSQLCQNHISGQLKVAPEHNSPAVLAAMGKSGWPVYRRFGKLYQETNEKIGKRQYLVPYFIAAHPGSTMKDAIALAEAMRDEGWQPEQVQLFIPTPGSRSTCMYYCGMDPRTMEYIYIPRSDKERNAQRALLQFRDPKNWPVVRQALLEAGRSDLIGKSKQCLVPPGDVAGGWTGTKKPQGGVKEQKIQQEQKTQQREAKEPKAQKENREKQPQPAKKANKPEKPEKSEKKGKPSKKSKNAETAKIPKTRKTPMAERQESAGHAFAKFDKSAMYGKPAKKAASAGLAKGGKPSDKGHSLEKLEKTANKGNPHKGKQLAMKEAGKPKPTSEKKRMGNGKKDKPGGKAKK